MKKIIYIILFFALTINLNANNLIESTVNQVKLHEGFRAKPYKDTCGLSIGYGTTLILTKNEAEVLLRMRLLKLYAELNKYYWFTQSNNARKQVLLDMAYNLGLNGLKSFKKMIWSLNHKYYHGAANAMKDSLWYRQVGNRGKLLYKMMYYGKRKKYLKTHDM